MPEFRTLDNLYRRLDEATNLVIAVRADVRLHSSADSLDSIRDMLTDCFAELAGILKCEREIDEPCSDTARDMGCSCREGSAYEYEPEPIRSRNCPLHGIDPDMARDDRDDTKQRRAG